MKRTCSSLCSTENRDKGKVSDYLWTSPDRRLSRLIFSVHFFVGTQMLLTYWQLFTVPNHKISCITTVLNYRRYAFLLGTAPLFTEAFPIILSNDCQPICLESTMEGEEQKNQHLYKN